MRHYVAGFLFDYNHSNVLLIHKQRPAWQAGLYNGIGGKVQSGETHYHAMVREFEEEAGLYFDAWRPLVTMQYSAEDEKDRSDEMAIVSFWYGTQVADEFEDFKSPTDETVSSIPVAMAANVPLYPNVRFMPGLRWMIPLALDDTAPKPLQNGGDRLSTIGYLRGP